MSVVGGKRARRVESVGPICEHCRKPVLEARFRRTNSLVRLDPEPRPDGNLARIELGNFVEYLSVAQRDPKSHLFVLPSDRYVSHRVTCEEHERTLQPADATFIAESEQRLRVAR